MIQYEELTETQEIVLTQEKVVEPYDLIIYNDDVNTFEFVIESLIEICKHNSIQAEQCTWIIHHNGKCAVKRGGVEKLKPMAEAFLNRGISAKIEA
ncbi:MAG: Clp protease ClpS [Flavobacteriales bacterium]|nr:Clp protease ClpS [Flavobacteriales bacterium]|tara:strand:- start:13726 stop:14013 length:288 start_codon:yes stop_codon:yes gene_type:complete